MDVRRIGCAQFTRSESFADADHWAGERVGLGKWYERRRRAHNIVRSFIIEFFAVAGASTNVLNAFLANGVANVTGLNVSPEVDIKAKVVLEKRDASNGVFIIMVAEPDISRLKRLSIDNIGRHILIVCHQEVVAAPVILGLMAAPQLVVTVKHVASVEKVLRD